MRKKDKNPVDGVNLVLFEPESEYVQSSLLSSCVRYGMEVGVDVETRDPNLLTLGPGAQRNDGEVVGIGLAWDNETAYFPIGHQGGGNLPKEAVLNNLKTCLKERYTWVGANVLYDAEWLIATGFTPVGHLIDIQGAESLLDEEAHSFSLNSLAKKYLGVSKNEELLKLAADAYNVNHRSELWKLHAKYVGNYCQSDAIQALEIWRIQKDLLKKEGLLNIFMNLEVPILNLCLQMRKQGVRVDIEAASRASAEWSSTIDELQSELDNKYNFNVNVNSGKHLKSICEIEKWDYPTTNLGNPSFDKTYFKYARSNTMKTVKRIRDLRKLKKDFVDKMILKMAHKGKIYAEFNPLGREDAGGGTKGARTGRFSSSNPNLQQVPSRDPDLAPIIRGFFIPNKGKKWAKLDYSKQEPRILVHYAAKMGLPGAAEAAQAYRDNPNLNYYELVSQGLDYTSSKILTLAIIYGEGIRKMAHDLNRSVDESKELMAKFDASNPYVRLLSSRVSKRAEEKGFIRTILGRHRHFVYWEPLESWAMEADGWDVAPVRGQGAAEEKWGNRPIRRAYLYKALNALVQGSAADMSKSAMLKIYNETGLIPHIPVHDELNYSVNSLDQAEHLKQIMENAIPNLEVPMVVDLDYGDNWK